MSRSSNRHRSSIFFRLIAMSILSVWFVLIGLGYGANDGFDNVTVGAVLTAGDQNCADDRNSDIAVDLQSLPAVFNLIVADSLLDRALQNAPKIPTERFSPFKTKCSLLL